MITLAIDYGDRYIGVAITDIDGQIAVRHSTIDQKNFDPLKTIGEIIQREKVSNLVVGIPKGLSGNETKQTRKTYKFIKRLKNEIGDVVNIEKVDETLTSVAARVNLKSEGKENAEEHEEAARLILEDYLKTNKLSELR